MPGCTIAHDAGLMEGKKGFDSSRSVWSDAGWREIKELRKMLEVNLAVKYAVSRSDSPFGVLHSLPLNTEEPNHP